jgi:hypothetical protein
MSTSSSMNGLPGADAMNDSLEFVRNMWGSMKIPGMAMPSLSPDEINKQITDLKAVESWLQVNMNMLRSSIQALEVQSATLSTLQAMSDSFTQAVTPQPAKEDKPPFDSPFNAFSSAAKETASAESQPKASAQSEAASAVPPLDPAAMAAQFANSAAWWNVVQDQFTQAVNSVMAPPAATAAAKPATKTAARSATKTAPKPATKSAAKRTTKPAAKKRARKKPESKPVETSTALDAKPAAARSRKKADKP